MSRKNGEDTADESGSQGTSTTVNDDSCQGTDLPTMGSIHSADDNAEFAMAFPNTEVQSQGMCVELKDVRALQSAGSHPRSVGKEAEAVIAERSLALTKLTASQEQPEAEISVSVRRGARAAPLSPREAAERRRQRQDAEVARRNANEWLTPMSASVNESLPAQPAIGTNKQASSPMREYTSRGQHSDDQKRARKSFDFIGQV